MDALGGRQMVTCGGSHSREAAPGHPATIATGLAAPSSSISLSSRTAPKSASHFGAWVVCTEKPGEFEVAGLDQDGNVVDSIRSPIRAE